MREAVLQSFGRLLNQNYQELLARAILSMDNKIISKYVGMSRKQMLIGGGKHLVGGTHIHTPSMPSYIVFHHTFLI